MVRYNLFFQYFFWMIRDWIFWVIVITSKLLMLSPKQIRIYKMGNNISVLMKISSQQRWNVLKPLISRSCVLCLCVPDYQEAFHVMWKINYLKNTKSANIQNIYQKAVFHQANKRKSILNWISHLFLWVNCFFTLFW